MATPTGRLIQDQNLNVHSTGASLGGKIDAYRATKNGALGGRRALNDISNSGKPSALQPSTKHNSINVVSTGKVLGAGKANMSKAPPEKVKAGGRKALSDLTNSAKPSVQHLSKKSQGQKVSAKDGENIQSAIKEEAFLHNHHDCIKARRNIMNFGFFLDTVGLDKAGSSLVLPETLELKKDSPVKCLEMEEMPMILNENKVAECGDAEFLGFSSPISVKHTYENWKDDNFLGFTLKETPKLQKF
ncbi:uncharacterized protein [Coffea arabica]|uniref:Uncharacterized protein isoform X3 n=1 Tax=Coffea arabica TaxID=13443 RepID=A0A6P6VP56_COFAR|nr:uncharacterized protein LOC113724988 isoform X3 [Coffea arabica]